jgi:hypothetical protein
MSRRQNMTKTIDDATTQRFLKAKRNLQTILKNIEPYSRRATHVSKALPSRWVASERECEIKMDK